MKFILHDSAKEQIDKLLTQAQNKKNLLEYISVEYLVELVPFGM